MTEMRALLTSILCFLLCFGSAGAPRKASSDNARHQLSTSNKIFIDVVDDFDKESNLPATLKAEVIKRGYAIADRKEEADVILNVSAQRMICFDDRAGECPRDKQICELRTSGGELLWKARFTLWKEFQGKKGVQHQAEEIVKRLIKH